MAPKKSSNVVWLSIAGMVLVGGGIGLALVLRGGGVASKEELVKQTFAALAAGDAGALAKLVDYDGVRQIIDCDQPDDAEDQDNRDEVRREIEKALEAAKDLEVEIVEVSDGKHEKFTKGGGASKHCKFKTDLELIDLQVRLQVRLKVAKGDKPGRAQKVRVTTRLVGGSWYLMEPPRLKAMGAKGSSMSN